MAALLSLVACALGIESTRYGIVFDAGSSGTRIHVYKWKTGGGGAKDAFDLVSDDLLKIKPGLSAFKEKTAEAGSSLEPLIAHAKAKIPAELVPSTPVFLMATAGLRMVGEQAKDAILRSVCNSLSSSGFLFRCEWATVLDGRDEGLFGWATVNYLIDAIYPPAPGTALREPVGTIDLGGGSVQIVFSIPTSEHSPAGYSHGFDFAGRRHRVYVKSHLGYGLDAARNAALDLLVSSKHSSADRPIRHPCLPKGSSLLHQGVEMVGDADWHRCSKLQARLFDHSGCRHSSCSWGGAYQPRLPAAVYGFSYLYDRTAAIGLFDGVAAQFGSHDASRSDLIRQGAALCALGQSTLNERFKDHSEASKAVNFCGDVAYLNALLSAFGFDEHTKLTLTNKIKDVELVWTLGAMLAKSSELSRSSSTRAASGSVSHSVLLVLAAALAFYFYTMRKGSQARHDARPLPQSEER